MIRPSWKSLLIGVVVAVALWSTASQADAQCWGCYRPIAWGGCYAPRYVSPCYTPCCPTVSCNPCYYGSDWYLGVRPGPVRRLLLGPYRWYRVGYGCGLGCGYSCGYDCGDASPCCNGAAVEPTQQMPTPAKKPVAEPPAAMPSEPAAPAPGPAVPNTTSISVEESGVLTVWVPYDAKVTINGLQTSSTGSRRQFVSYGLKPGLSYKYVVKAEVVRNGQMVEDIRTVALTAGQTSAVAFGFNTTAPEQVAAAH
jgi:uncharacterized protein (TIGR03000 family)